MSTVTPFAKGQLAYTAGTPIYDNPYTWHNDAWDKWNKGWTAAKAAARKAQQAADLEAIEARTLDSWVTEEETK